MNRMRVLAAAALFAAGACGGEDPGSSDSAVGAEETVRSRASFDLRWMERMIDHHLMAVEMAGLCEELAERDQLAHETPFYADLCAPILETQTAEILLMQGWLEEWYGVAYEGSSGGGMGMGMGMGMGRMGGAELEGLTGSAFELAFMQDMIPHHRQAVHMSEVCAERAQHEALRELCAEIVVAQTAEIALMQGWLCDWYDVCGPAGAMGGGGMGGGGAGGGGMGGPGSGGRCR